MPTYLVSRATPSAVGNLLLQPTYHCKFGLHVQLVRAGDEAHAFDGIGLGGSGDWRKGGVDDGRMPIPEPKR